MSGLRHTQGFTLIELLVALAILAVLSAQLFLVFQTQKATYVTNEQALDAQEDARLVMDLIASDARMAGYMIPEVAGVASIDGGNSDADDLCVSDSTVINDAVLDSASDHFTRARMASVDSGTQITLSSVAQLNVDNDASSANDFSVGQGIIISDGAVSHCARITAIDASNGEIDFDTALASGSITALNANIGAARAVPAVLYRVGTSGLTRNGVIVSSEIEDLQIEFGVDVNSDNQLSGSSEVDRDSLGGSDPALVRAIQISVIARSPQPDPDYLGSDRGRPASANRNAGASDTFLRRRFVSSVLPRNLM
jgi:prepilin-type N-terminal cleavage/methylation domain-containing protein